MKLGKTPARPRPKDIVLAEVVNAGTTLPQAPVGFGHWTKIGVNGWGMLGNDSYGDCVFAGGDHETRLVNAMNQRIVTFDDHSALGDYAAVTGFDPDAGPPGENPTDRGTDVHDALNYRRETGLVDATGTRHKVGAYVSLEPGNWPQMLEALRVFDFVGIGFEFPDYAMTQFNQGKPWTYRAGGTIDGGHYVPVVGRPHSWTVATVTWGRLQLLGRRFYEHYVDEAYGVLTLETLNGQGRTPEGLDLPGLQAALAAL